MLAVSWSGNDSSVQRALAVAPSVADISIAYPPVARCPSRSCFRISVMYASDA